MALCILNPDENEKLKNELTKILEDKRKIEIAQLKKPRLKIVGVENDYDVEQTTQALKNQNFIECENEDFTILHVHTVKDKNTKIIYLETTSTIFYKLTAQYNQSINLHKPGRGAGFMKI